MTLPNPEEVQPGVYQIGDDIALIAVTSKLILIGIDNGKIHRESLLAFLSARWPDKETAFLAFPTTGRSNFKAITEVPELRKAISDIVNEQLKAVFGTMQGDGK